MERLTRSKVIKFYKVIWNNHSEQDATWEHEDYLRRFILVSTRNGRSCNLGTRFLLGGKGCNTLGVKHALNLDNA